MSEPELPEGLAKTVSLGASPVPPPPHIVYGLPAPLGKYTLVERLGVGGMAEVFLATQDGPAGFRKRHVIKRCLPHLAEDTRFIEMFLREARVASRLNHPNVVAVHELGQVGNSYFLVMEYVDGLTLRRLAQRAWAHHRTIPTELIINAIADAALGLHHAHTLLAADGKPAGMVHRDISPENLMIDKDGNTKVLDFGIARDAGTGSLTKTGELKGKIPFMSPEQIRGGDVDGRADLYALGVTMYWLLTGRRPHSAPSELILLNEILNATPKPPSAFNPAVPADLDELCVALIERDRELRPPTGLAVYEALAQAGAARTTVVGPFVRSVAQLADGGSLPGALDEADTDAVTGAGFIPSEPQTSIALAGWHRLDRVRGAPPATAATSAPPASQPAAPPRRPRLASAVAAAVGAVLVVGAVAAIVRRGDDTVAAASSPPMPASPPVVPAAAPPPPAPVTAPAGAEPEVAAAANGAEATPPAAPPRPAPSQRVALKAPTNVKWLLPKGVRLAGGIAELPVSQRSVRAQDAVTRGVVAVPIEGGVADYRRLKSGTLDVRALPWAKVSVGRLDLGVTPFEPRALVEGTYEVRLEHQGKSELRTVTIRAGRTERVVVDYRGR